MRVSERHLRAQNEKNRLILQIHETTDGLELTDEEEIRNLSSILMYLGAGVKLEVQSVILTDDVLSYVEDGRLTKIEAMQAIVEYLQSKLNYMLRYERHGNYDTPAGLETPNA